MPESPRDEQREHRIQMEIVVDAYGPEEQAGSWYAYLEENLQFPFVACCVTERAISPLQLGDEIDVVGMAPEDECAHEMFVLMPWERRTLAVPLSQLDARDTDDETRQAIGDWRYWVERGYEL